MPTSDVHLRLPDGTELELSEMMWSTLVEKFPDLSDRGRIEAAQEMLSEWPDGWLRRFRALCEAERATCRRPSLSARPF